MDADVLSQLCHLVQSDENFDKICERLNGGINPNFQLSLVTKLLHVAAESKLDNIRVVRELINAGADVNLANKYGLTPLHYAVLQRKRCVVDVLIQSGANINAKSSLKRTALHFAISNYQYNHRKRTSLSHSSGPDIWIVIKLLNQENMHINKGDFRGDTPLMWAVIHKQLDTVLLLLEKGANPSTHNKDFKTPLHIALSDQDPSLAILVQLLMNRASLKCADRNGKTPIDILITNIRNTQSYCIAYMCLKVIALSYSVKKPLKRKLKSIPQLWYYLKNCCAEVARMKRDIIATRLTVFDFIMKRIKESDPHKPVFQVYKSIVERLLAGLYLKYFNLVLLRVSKSNLFAVLKITVLYHEEMSTAHCKKMTYAKNHKKLSDAMGFKEMPDSKDCKEMPDSKDCKEMPDLKDCKEMSDAKDCTKINLTKLLLKIDLWNLSKYFSCSDVFHLISAFSKVKIGGCNSFAKKDYN